MVECREGQVSLKKYNGDHCMVGNLNEEVKWRTLYGGVQWGESLNREAEWRPLYVKVLHSESTI